MNKGEGMDMEPQPLFVNGNLLIKGKGRNKVER